MWDELRRPATAIAFGLLLISILVGALVSAYFYHKGVKYAKLTYETEQVQIFDKHAGGVLPLTIHDSSGNIIDQNIYAANVSVWNSGNAELKNDDVRQAFRVIVEDGSAKIIEITPTLYTRDNIDGFNVNSTTGGINWTHFDASEGFKLRVIYTNSSVSNIKIQGYALNTPIVDYTTLATYKITQENTAYLAAWYDLWALFISIIVLLVGLIVWLTKAEADRPANIKELVWEFVPWRIIVPASIIIALAGVAVYFYVVGMPVAPLPRKPF